MIIITAPTGQIGSQVLEKLLKTNEKLRVIARDPSRIPFETRKKIEIIQGSHGDYKIVSEAYASADDLFLLIPPSMQYSDADDYYLDFVEPSLRAIREQGIKRVVYVSGTGLGHEKNAGPVSASYLVEKDLEETGAATRMLHCGTFMENLLNSVEWLKTTGRFSTCISGSVKAPWVSTRDIADRAVQLLVDKSWSGNDSVGVLGPEDLSYDEIARIMSGVLGREVRYETVSAEILKERLIGFGASKAAAEGLIEIYDSIERGVFNMVPRTPESASPTSFHVWCEEVFKPAFLK